MLPGKFPRGTGLGNRASSVHCSYVLHCDRLKQIVLRFFCQSNVSLLSPQAENNKKSDECIYVSSLTLVLFLETDSDLAVSKFHPYFLVREPSCTKMHWRVFVIYTIQTCIELGGTSSIIETYGSCVPVLNKKMELASSLKSGQTFPLFRRSWAQRSLLRCQNRMLKPHYFFFGLRDTFIQDIFNYV